MSFFGSDPYSAYAPRPSYSSFFPSFGSSDYSYGSSGGWGKTIGMVIGGIFLIFVGIAFYDYLRKRKGLSTIFPTTSSSGDKTPSPVDGKTKTTISSSEAPTGSGDFALQYWMYIKDWDYKFGQEKDIVKRVGSGFDSPRITLHPTDNSLNVRVSIYPQNTSSGSAANPTASSTGDSFTCSVENVPLQTWFSVSVSVYQRNLDIYINGRLVKSCVLPGVLKPATGDIVLGDSGGFSGSICNLHSYTNALGPDEAKAFFDAGTSCQAPTPSVTNAVDKNSTFITLFGYTFRFSTLDKTGNEINSYTL